jgi:hypothetical protein
MTPDDFDQMEFADSLARISLLGAAYVALAIKRLSSMQEAAAARSALMASCTPDEDDSIAF